MSMKAIMYFSMKKCSPTSYAFILNGTSSRVLCYAFVMVANMLGFKRVLTLEFGL